MESSEEEDNNKFNFTKYKEILDNIERDQRNYNLYEKLVDESYKKNDLGTIRSAHELFTRMFPLAASIWCKWILFEITLINLENKMQVEHIMNMFNRALNDCYSGDVAIENATFLNEVQVEVSDLVWDRLLDSYGPLLRHGSRIFDFARAYYLGSNFVPPTTLPTKIINTYIKQLEMPLEDIDRTYQDFRDYYMRNESNVPAINWEDINRTYKTTKRNLDLILPFENKLEINRDYSLYVEYLNKVENKIPENWYQCIFGRATTDLWLNADIWIRYVNYIRKRDKHKSSDIENLQACTLYTKNTMDIINQAIRNCPRELKLYVHQMNIAEENSLIYPAGRIKTILENAIKALGSKNSSLPLLWLEYISYLQRNTKFDNRDEFDIFRTECEEAVDMCYSDDNTTLDPLYEIYRLWGTIEYTFGDLEQARYLWEKVGNKVKGANQAAVWTQYADLEIQFGNIGEARNVFIRGATAILSQPFDVQDSLSDQFETFYRNRRSTHITESEQIAHGSKEDASSILYRAAEMIAFEQIRIHFSFWMQFERIYGESIHIRRAEEFIEKLMKNSNRNQSERREIKMESANSSFEISKRRKLEILESREDNQAENVVAQHQHTELDTTKDSVTIFLSNLHFGITEEEVRLAFPELIVNSVCLMIASNDKDKCFGYLELDSEDAVKQALTFDRRPIKGRPVFISDVTRDKNKKRAFRYSGEVIFVRGIPRSDRAEEELKVLFSKYGKIKDTLLVSYKSGTQKGMAYIEYFVKASASNAVNDTEKKFIGDTEVFVSNSEPPCRDATSRNVVRTTEMPGTSKRSKRPPTGQQMNIIQSMLSELRKMI